MALNDSLNSREKDVEGTYRIQNLQPQSIKNEEEFVINSARKQKNFFPHNNHQQDENNPPGMSESLQAELHLSLDRLSENSYDFDDLTRIKLKSQNAQKISKVYPMLHNASRTSLSDKEELPYLKSSVLASNGQQNKSDNDGKSESHHVVQQKDLSDQNSLSNNSKELQTQNKESEAPRAGDEDSDSTIVQNSLSSDTPRNAIQDQDHSNKNSSNAENDPYAYLRYNPDWRNETIISSGGEDGDHLIGNSNNIGFHHTDNIANPTYSEGGAITVHNKELLQARDSPVRLSADPSKLLLLNEKYETEFNHLLEQEQLWKVEEEEANQLSSAVEENFASLNQITSKSKLKSPSSYKKFTSQGNTERTAKKPDIPTKKTSSDSHKITKKEKNLAYPPSPPKPSKPSRDYIELNKARLGRKSNSASYLEMYSKKNRLLEQARDSPRRPLSDIRQTQKHPHNESDHDSATADETALGVEEIWKRQADRLKLAKEANAKVRDRKAMREVGDHNATRPSVSPRRLFPQHGSSKVESPSRDRSLSKLTSPSRDVSPSIKSDFSNHPAFTPFLQRAPSHKSEDLNSSQDSAYLNDYRTEPSPYRGIEPNSYYNSSSNASFHSSSHYRHDASEVFGANREFHLPTGHPQYQTHPSSHPYFHQVYKEDFRNFHPSPMIQAYQHRFVQPNPIYSANKLLPHHEMLVHERNHNFTIDPSRDLLSIPTQEISRGNLYHSGYHQMGNHHPLPLPPSVKDLDSASFNPVPRLPPISINSDGERLSTENAPVRQSFSDSDAAADGSYLRQHEKKKQKPAYKRYTLDDYKSLKRDINVGGLGPDLLTAKLKMEKVDRVRKYSEFIRQQHRNNVIKIHNNSSADDPGTGPSDDTLATEPRQRFTLGDSEKKKLELLERRKKALNYAKQVPKPKAVVAPITASDKTQDVSRDENLDDSEQILEWDLVKSLRERHEKEKAKVAEMTSPRRVT